MPLAKSLKKAASGKANTVKKVGGKVAHTAAAPAKRGRGRPKGSGANKVSKASAKSSAPKTVKKATGGRKAMSIEERRKRTRDAVRAFRAKQRAKGLTYNTKTGRYVPYKSKATMAAAKKRAGKNSPLWGKRPAGLKAALAKRKVTLSKRKPGYTKFGRKRLPRVPGGRVGTRPALAAKTTKSAKGKKAAAAAGTSNAKRGRGRSKGSTKKTSAEKTMAAAKGFLVRRVRGRPKGSGKK